MRKVWSNLNSAVTYINVRCQERSQGDPEISRIKVHGAVVEDRLPVGVTYGSL